jgi:hypothetical protein
VACAGALNPLGISSFCTLRHVYYTTTWQGDQQRRCCWTSEALRRLDWGMRMLKRIIIPFLPVQKSWYQGQSPKNCRRGFFLADSKKDLSRGFVLADSKKDLICRCSEHARPLPPTHNSSSTHRFPDERTPIEATPLSATSAELGLGLGLGLGLDSLTHSSSHARPFFSPPSFHTLAFPPAFTSVWWSA